MVRGHDYIEIAKEIRFIKFFSVKSCGKHWAFFCIQPFPMVKLFCDWLTRARCIFDIKIFRLKMFELALCNTYRYCIMSINTTNFFSSLNRILPFFVIKFQNVSIFFFSFTHFQNAITFDWINQYHNFLFLITPWYVTFQTHARIARSD